MNSDFVVVHSCVVFGTGCVKFHTFYEYIGSTSVRVWWLMGPYTILCLLIL